MSKSIWMEGVVLEKWIKGLELWLDENDIPYTLVGNHFYLENEEDLLRYNLKWT